MSYKVEAWPWCADYCKKNKHSPYDSYFWDKAMLEYRRQHNIFEAGDVAVSVDGESYLHKIELGTSKEHCIKIFSHDMAHSYWVHDVNYRHATDEEIAAGHRL